MGRDYLARCRSIRVRDGKSCEMPRQRTSESFRIRLRFGVVPERDLLHHCRTAQASVKWTLIIAFGNTVRSQLEVNERICRTRLGRTLCRHRKKAAEAICQEVTREHSLRLGTALGTQYEAWTTERGFDVGEDVLYQGADKRGVSRRGFQCGQHSPVQRSERNFRLPSVAL